MTMPRVITHRAGLSLVALILATTLAACGGDDPAPTPTLPPPPATTAAAPASASPVGGTPVATPVDPSALLPGEVTLGQIADRIAAAWPSVTSYRSETVNLLEDGSPVPNAASVTSEVILPDRKRFVAVEGGTTTEIVYVGGALFTRVIDGAWTAVDVGSLAEGDRFRETYAQMTQPVAPPYAGVSGRERERVGRDAGTVAVGDRTCTAYAFPEVGVAGERIEITVLIDAAGLPCSIETLTGATRNRTTFTYNLPLAIDAPAGITPSPVASPIPVEPDQADS